MPEQPPAAVLTATPQTYRKHRGTEMTEQSKTIEYADIIEPPGHLTITTMNLESERGITLMMSNAYSGPIRPPIP